MNIRILGDFNPDQLYCAGSVTKFMTTYVVLSFLASKNHDLDKILDDEDFLDSIAFNAEAKAFLTNFQNIIGSQFTLRDLCTYYAGLPYTFDPTDESIENVDAGNPFKHHQLPDEETFLKLCREKVKSVYPNRSNYHYSELSIIFMSYFIEKAYSVKMEDLYDNFIIKNFKVKQSCLSRTRPNNVYIQDLSDKYDYAAVAVQDHGFFCYSNGFYTTLNELRVILEGILQDPVYQHHIANIEKARHACDDIISGMAVELRVKGDDIVVGYEGLSFSGCNIWSFSNKLQQGYVTFCDDEEAAYQLIYAKFGYEDFDPAPASTRQYSEFYKNAYPGVQENCDVPVEYQGKYQRVRINDIELPSLTVLGNHYLTIRDPEETTYTLTHQKNSGYHIEGDDGIPDSRVGLIQSHAGNRFMFYNGSLYKRVAPLELDAQSPQLKK